MSQQLTQSDLMIGDYVTDVWASPGCMWRITSFNSRHVRYGAFKANFRARYANIRPVELTDELLDRFKFKRDKLGAWIIPNTKYIVRPVEYGKPHVPSGVSDKGYSFELDSKDSWEDLTRINYVHELQRLLATLTDIKLAIEL